MLTTITATRQWQVHIPKSLREAIGWERPGKATAKAVKGKIVIEPQESEIMKLAGSLSHIKPTKKIDIDNIRDYIDYSDL